MDGKRDKIRDNAELEVAVMISLYNKNETDFSHNGKSILKPIKAVITEELNGDSGISYFPVPRNVFLKK